MLGEILAVTDPLTTVLLAAFGVHFGHRFDRLDRRVQRLEAGLFQADGGRQELPDAPSEDATDGDGLLSYAGEWHALALGAGAGLAASVGDRPELVVVVVAIALGVRAAPTSKLKELRREPWYATGGAVLAYVGADVVDVVAAALPI